MSRVCIWLFFVVVAVAAAVFYSAETALKAAYLLGNQLSLSCTPVQHYVFLHLFPL